jgi:hypothetical protein
MDQRATWPVDVIPRAVGVAKDIPETLHSRSLTLPADHHQFPCPAEATTNISRVELK